MIAQGFFVEKRYSILVLEKQTKTNQTCKIRLYQSGYISINPINNCINQPSYYYWVTTTAAAANTTASTTPIGHLLDVRGKVALGGAIARRRSQGLDTPLDKARLIRISIFSIIIYNLIIYITIITRRKPGHFLREAPHQADAGTHSGAVAAKAALCIVIAAEAYQS